ncbi:hypothetical protein F4802DRAFT_553523 [Xylaria palmicola]|nr:hypothetical protein F4802DRAFT_553523 [Xylaria palmicola]
MAPHRHHVLSSDDWVPQNEGEARLKAALQGALVSSPKSVIINEPTYASNNRFVLQTQGYHHIYLYVVEGIKFTSTKEAFAKDFPRKTFAAVDKIDINAYGQLQDTTVNVATHCNDFNTNGLGKLTTSANGAITYADHAIGVLKEKQDISLYSAFQVLLDAKYATHPKDQAFTEAVETAKLAVQNLQKSAREKAKDAKEMVGLLEAFYTKTSNDVTAVSTVDANFHTGPIDPRTGKRKLKPDGKEQEAYGDVMQADIKRLQDEIDQDNLDKDDAYDQWKEHRDKAIGYGVGGWWFPWLLIPAGLETDKAIKAKNRYDDLVAEITKDSQDKGDEVKVLELVRALVNHFHDLLPKMKTALTAMQELEHLFNEQNANFQKVLDNFEDLQTGITAVGLKARQNWINNGIDEAVETFKEIRDLGKEFQKGAVPEIKKL